MSKKRLDEGTIRRFAQLANIPALGAISEMSYARDDEALPGAEEDPMASDPMADEAPVDEPIEDEAPAEAGDVDVLGLVNAIADAITSETGVEVTASEEVEGEGAPEEELPLPEEEPPAEELAPEEAPLAEVEKDLAAANVEIDATGDLVNEITRRVARRLLRDSASKK